MGGGVEREDVRLTGAELDRGGTGAGAGAGQWVMEWGAACCVVGLTREPSRWIPPSLGCRALQLRCPPPPVGPQPTLAPNSPFKSE